MPDRETMSPDRMLDRLVAICHEMRGEDVVALDVRELVEYMDYLLIVSARSERQNRAIAEALGRAMKREGILPLSKAGVDGGAWICLDLVDVVVHLFTPEQRAHYDLELLWGDAERVDLPAPSAPKDPMEPMEPMEPSEEADMGGSVPETLPPPNDA